MKTTVVRYKVKADRAEENIRYINGVFEALKRESPSGLRYTSIQLEDGVSFIHIASIAEGVESNPLTELPAFKQFTADIRDRCEIPPSASSATVVGAHDTLRD